MHPLGTSAEQSKACIADGVQFYSPSQALIQQFYYNCRYFILLLKNRAIFYVSAKQRVRHKRLKFFCGTSNVQIGSFDHVEKIKKIESNRLSDKLYSCVQLQVQQPIRKD